MRAHQYGTRSIQNVLRELGKTTPHKNVTAWLKTVDDADLAISALSVHEITKGIAKPGKKKPESAAALEHAVNAIFEVDREVAAAWGEAMGESDKHVDDAGLAATALVHSLTVFTRNVADFSGHNVKLVDPFKAARHRT